jgi:hypothetical protein
VHCLGVRRRSRPAVTEESTQAAPSPDPGSELGVKWEGGKLSLDAEAVPLLEVLRAVSDATGIEITGAHGLSGRASAHFARLDLLQALKQLLARVDYAIAAGPRALLRPRVPGSSFSVERGMRDGPVSRHG